MHGITVNLFDPGIRRIMIDIETLDTVPTAKIISIGAYDFSADRHLEDNVLRGTFYIEISEDGQPYRTVSQSTLDWWKLPEQADKYPQGIIALDIALYRLYEFVKTLDNRKNLEIWCKGTDFDTLILKNAFDSYGIPIPWKYNSVRDMRTILKLFPGMDFGVTNQNPHNAVADAIFQGDQLIHIFSRLQAFLDETLP